MIKISRSATLIGVLSVWSCLLAGNVKPVQARSCAIPLGTAEDIQQESNAADAIFVGAIVSERLLYQEKDRFETHYELKVRVSQVWKGDRTRIKYIDREGSSTGQVGKEFIFFPRQRGLTLHMGYCDFLQFYSPALYDPQLNALYGPPAIAHWSWPVSLTSFQRQVGWVVLFLLSDLILTLSYLQYLYSNLDKAAQEK